MDHCCLSDRGRARRVALTPAGARQTAAASTTPPAARGPSAPTSIPPGGPQLGVRTHTRAGPGRPARSVGGHLHAPGHRVVAAATTTAMRPETGRRPAPDPAPGLGEGTTALPRPTLPLPNPPETSVCSALPVLRQPTALATTRRRLRAAHAASGWRTVWKSSRNFPSARTGSRGYPEAGGRLPRASNRIAANGATRPRGWQRDFRVRSSDTPLPMEKMDQSEASVKAALRFKLSKGNSSLAAAWPNG